MQKNRIKTPDLEDNIRKRTDEKIYILKDNKEQIGVNEITLNFAETIFGITEGSKNSRKQRDQEIEKILNEVRNMKKMSDKDSKNFIKFYGCFFSYELKKVFIIQEELEKSLEYGRFEFLKKFYEKERIGFYKDIFKRLIMLNQEDLDYFFFDIKEDINLNGDDLKDF